ncbi:hypothetical protein [Capnocytophaga canis]|uniref:hypothetical protein n=1 Tax=Capnocytophaga canis TaxID=1848903 RepID=UPI0037D7E0C5
MEKQIFKAGDRVFDIRYGWGEVKEDDYTQPYHKLKIVFDENKNDYHLYTEEGSNEIAGVPTLSFTEYTLDGFSQERPIDYNDYIGKWGKFYDDKERSNDFVISKLVYYDEDANNDFETTDGHKYNYFEPLTEEQVKILGLE